MSRNESSNPVKIEKRGGKRPQFIDVHSTKSHKPGLAGAFESFVRSFQSIGFVIVFVPVVMVALSCMGLALSPALFVFDMISRSVATFPMWAQAIAKGLGFAAGFFIYGVSLIFIAPMANKLMPYKLKAWRGNWFSLQSVPWFYHNALTYIVRFTFLDFVTPSPLNILFFKMMGMKIGKGVMINTSFISDPCMITLEDYVTIGGSATLFGHYGQKGILILSPVVIKRGATIGLKASIMGDVVVGEKVIVPAHTVLLPKTRIPNGARFKLPESQIIVSEEEGSEVQNNTAPIKDEGKAS
ncbi:MAG: hypothetical protein HYV97_15025 [Bdellovibrio sp.]|nr:hypothetical protein [Bdellovibrio sp.]